MQYELVSDLVMYKYCIIILYKSIFVHYTLTSDTVSGIIVIGIIA